MCYVILDFYKINIEKGIVQEILSKLNESVFLNDTQPCAHHLSLPHTDCFDCGCLFILYLSVFFHSSLAHRI